MFQYLRLFFIISLIVFAQSPALALTQEEKEHATSAFMFSERKQWSDALLHANKSNSGVLQNLVKWQYLLDSESGATFSEIREFLNQHPDWPEQKKLRIRAEMGIPDADPSADELIAWFGDKTPITGVGKFMLSNALMKVGNASTDKLQELIREAWRDGDFTEAQEKLLLDSYGVFIHKEDDVKRTDRLLWEKKYSAAERMYERVGKTHEQLYKARRALQENKKDAASLVAKLPSDLHKDAGLIFDRMVYRDKKDDDNGVREMLLAAPKKVPYPERWWKYRETHIRGAIADGNIKLAEKLLANHGQEEGQEFMLGFADASWLHGLILLEHKKHPKDAYQAFYRMFNSVKYPVSKARAAYWTAKAADKAGDTEAAKSWYNTATAYPTTFYGQLAAAKYLGTAPLHIPASPDVSSEVRAEFDSRNIVQAIKLCLEFNEISLAEKLINHLIAEADDPMEDVLASELGKKAGKTYLSVRAAKKALKKNVVLLDIGYPTPATPDNLAIPRELALSITRQESEFDTMARSPANAHGLMQLLPSTAKETAKKNDITFNASRLYEKDYNMTLGSLYLSRMIDHYDGSYILAIASYNAGPGNVYKWVQKFGRPRRSIDNAVEWIEKIPFAETRNYVQRVLENLQVYRYIEAQKNANSSAKLQLEQDLLR